MILTRKPSKTVGDLFSSHENELSRIYLFNAMYTDQQLSVPWKDSYLYVDTTFMDSQFFTSFGSRPASKFFISNYKNYVNEYAFNPDDNLTSEGKIQIAKMIHAKYHNKWMRLWNVYNAEYNPLHNYDMTETESGQNKSDRTLRIVGTGTEQNTGTTSSNATSTSESNNDVYGFDASVGAVPSNKNTTNGTNDVSNNQNLVSERNTTDTHTDTADNINSRSLTRSGNIGVMSTTELIQRDINLWQWSFIDAVFEDVLKELSLSTY